jgi:hypothetical protein
MLLVTAVCALLQPASNWIRTQAPLLLFAALLAVVGLANLRVHNARADGPQWSKELARARAACATHRPGDLVDVVIPPSAADQSAQQPDQPPVTWTAQLPCAYLLR